MLSWIGLVLKAVLVLVAAVTVIATFIEGSHPMEGCVDRSVDAGLSTDAAITACEGFDQ